MFVGIAGSLYAYDVHDHVCNIWSFTLQMHTEITLEETWNT